MELNKEIEKKIVQIKILEDQIGQMEEQMRLIDREILEFNALQSILDEIKESTNREIIVPLGKDVFIKSKIDDGSRILVNVGSRTIVEKDIEQTKNILMNKMDTFLEARESIGKEADDIIQKIEKIDKEIMGIQSRTNK